MEYIYGAIIGIMVYTLIGLLLVLLTNENETVAMCFAGGVWAVLIAIIVSVVDYIKGFIKNKRYKSIIADKSTGKKYWCESKCFDDFWGWSLEYDGIKRYASKDEWKDLPCVTKDMIEKAQRNCDHCIYNNKKYCKEDEPLCKHEGFGQITEFDKFERKT